MSTRNLLTLIEQGGVAMYPLLLFSVVSVAVVLERTWAITRAARAAHRLHRLVLQAADRPGLSDALAIARLDTSPLGRVYEGVLTHTGEDMRAHIARRRHAEGTRELKRSIWLLGTLGSLAPFVGLFGTVIGIIRAFENMAATGSGGFAVVAAGISEALIATACGLIVGILSIFAYNAFLIRIGEVTATWRDWTDDLLLRLAREQ